MQSSAQSGRPDYNIPVWNETDFYWDDLHIANVYLSELIPTNGGKWAGCMWHGPIWRADSREGFNMLMYVLNGKEVFETFVHVHELPEWHPSYNEERADWNPENPCALVPSWTYRSLNNDGLEHMYVTIHNDIGLTIQEIDDICLNGMPSQPTENYRQVFQDEDESKHNTYLEFY